MYWCSKVSLMRGTLEGHKEFSILQYGVVVLIVNRNCNCCYKKYFYSGGSITWEATV